MYISLLLFIHIGNPLAFKMLKLFVICVFQKCLVIVLLVKLMEKQEKDKLIMNNLQ